MLKINWYSPIFHCETLLKKQSVTVVLLEISIIYHLILNI